MESAKKKAKAKEKKGFPGLCLFRLQFLHQWAQPYILSAL